MHKCLKLLISIWPVAFMASFVIMCFHTPGSAEGSLWARITLLIGPTPGIIFLLIRGFRSWWAWIKE